MCRLSLGKVGGKGRGGGGLSGHVQTENTLHQTGLHQSGHLLYVIVRSARLVGVDDVQQAVVEAEAQATETDDQQRSVDQHEEKLSERA